MTLPLKHPLAFGVTREPIWLPREAFGWRVRFVPCGSLASGRGGEPESVQGKDGAPLYLRSTEALAELQKAVSRDGLYRLDAVDEDLFVLDVEPAYVEVCTPTASVKTWGEAALVIGVAIGASVALAGMPAPPPQPPLPRAQEQLSLKPAAARGALAAPSLQLPPKRQ